MAKQSVKTADESPQTLSELDALRDIVFGNAKAELEAHIATLKDETTAAFKHMENELRKNVRAMQAALQDSVEQLTDRLERIDKLHEDKEAELQAYADKLSSELEMTDANSRQENDQLHNRVDQEVSELTKKYDAKLAEAMERLNQVTNELSTSKADRKTLAKLLASMATNLETDQD